jgi:CheY-like chemotaxis protein
MRNPLSAILQCADEIASSLSDYRDDASKGVAPPAELLESNIDAAQTIALCAQHQKRIVDDVLTLSKLDSALLLVTPVDVRPVAVVQRALKMFESELQTNDIEMKFEVLDSYREHGIDWVRLDPSRLLQVLINLTSNAIKFTHARDKRTIVVSIGASRERPSASPESSVSYFSSRLEQTDPTNGLDWGTGEGVFLTFAVQDTGLGLDEAEKKLLFLRFSQASPRTHVQYGGSGLGLFISRELTELQGGEIGVSSESGKGSTFAFYIKVRRSMADHAGAEEHAVRQFATRQLSNGYRKRVASPVNLPPARPDATTASKPVVNRENDHIKVLIVEDNLVNQRVLQKQLHNLGCVVHLANHGGEALERLRESRFAKGREADGLDLSLVLMDLEMPVMNGLVCAREIRKLQTEGSFVRHVPIIAVTANARPEQVQTALDAGMVS